MKDDPGGAQRDHWTHPTTTTKETKQANSTTKQNNYHRLPATQTNKKQAIKKNNSIKNKTGFLLQQKRYTFLPRFEFFCGFYFCN